MNPEVIGSIAILYFIGFASLNMTKVVTRLGQVLTGIQIVGLLFALWAVWS